jgi:hypothetical protein
MPEQHVPLPPSPNVLSMSSATPPPNSLPTMPPRRSARHAAPSLYVQDIASREGSMDNLARSRGCLLPGMGPTASIEYALAADISEADGLEPHNLAEAKRSPDWPQWEAAINERLAMLEANGTWELLDAPDDTNVVGIKWVFRGCRLLRHVFTRSSPGIRPHHPRVSCATRSGHQIDIKDAYLNSELTDDERIFMCQPPGFHSPIPPAKSSVSRRHFTA